jgi:hypothetical protein
MKMILSEAASITRQTSPVAPVLGVTGEAAVVGAVYVKNDEQIFYRAVDASEIETLLDSATRHLHLFGMNEEQIERELLKRHPSPRVEVTRLKQATGFYVHINNKQIHVKLAWLMLPRPMVTDAVKTLTELTSVSIALGPVLIEYWQFNRLFGASHYNQKQADEAGFTVLTVSVPHLDSTIYQVNFNPKARKRREYLQAKAKVQERTGGQFTSYVLNRLYSALSPTHWPNSHPYNGVVQGRPETYKSGWGRTSDNSFSVSDVAGLIELNRKLNSSTWWRDRDRSGWTTKLEAALLLVHTVEQEAREHAKELLSNNQSHYRNHQRICEEHVKSREDIMALLRFEDEGGALLNDREVGIEQRYYDTEERDWRYKTVSHWAIGWPNRENYDVGTIWINWFEDTQPAFYPESAAEWVERETKKELRDSEAGQAATICRWLRREAKAVKIPMPRPPKMPISPAELRKRASDRRKRRRLKEKEKRNGIRNVERRADR